MYCYEKMDLFVRVCFCLLLIVITASVASFTIVEMKYLPKYRQAEIDKLTRIEMD